MRSKLIRRAGAAASVAVLLPLSASAMAAPTSGWHTVDMTARQGIFISVTAADQRHAWAVGESPTKNGNGVVPLISRWNGVSWTPVGLPAKVLSRLGSVAPIETAVASGPRSLWAFPLTGGWLHYDGSSWTTGTVPGELVTVASAVAARKYTWAFGIGDVSGKPVPISAYATDINGKVKWTRKAIPGAALIEGASSVSGSDLWAVGISGWSGGFIGPLTGARSNMMRARELIGGRGIPALGGIAGSVTFKAAGATSGLLHYYAGRWHKLMPLPEAMRKIAARSIFARSDTDVWVGGAVKNAVGGTTEAIAHWNGRGWTLMKLPARASKADYLTYALSTDGSGGLWALAVCASTTCPQAGLATRLWHEKAGRWTGPIHPSLARHPTVLVGLAAAGRTVWAVGGVRLAKNNIRGLIAAWTAADR